jgi:hypothetical protein
MVVGIAAIGIVTAWLVKQNFASKSNNLSPTPPSGSPTAVAEHKGDFSGEPSGVSALTDRDAPPG